MGHWREIADFLLSFRMIEFEIVKDPDETLKASELEAEDGILEDSGLEFECEILKDPVSHSLCPKSYPPLRNLPPVHG